MRFSSLLLLLSLLVYIRYSDSQDNTELVGPTFDQLTGQIDVRLVHNYRCRGGKRFSRGRVEVFLYGQWGTICRNRLSRATGDVLCREMGFSHYIPHDYLYCERAESEVPMWLSDIECKGTESNFEQCELNFNRLTFCRDYYGYYHGRDLSLTCGKKVHQSPTYLPVSLSLPTPVQDPETPIPTLLSSCAGVVTISYQETTGYISAVGVQSVVGSIICEQLGYYKYLGPLPDEYLRGVNQSIPILLAKPACLGKESELKDCPHWGWGPFPHLSQYGAYSVQCACEPKLQCGEPEESILRLRSRPVPWEGRLEVKIDGEWGSVCGHGFSREAATVACRQLGLGAYVSYHKSDARNGGYGDIKLRDVACVGNEESLLDCPHYLIESTDRYCTSHYTDIILRCNAESPAPKVRLISPAHVSDYRFGGVCKLLEFQHEGEWYPHCCEGDTGVQYDLATACREAEASYITSSGCTPQRSDVINSTHGVFSCEKNSCFTDSCKSGNWTISDSCPSRRYTFVCCSRTMADLVPNKDKLLGSLGGVRSLRYVQSVYTSNIRCAVEDGCLGPDANPDLYTQKRSLLRFSTQSENLGNNHFRPPVSNDAWIWHNCHKHFHSMEHFVDYTLTSLDGSITVGHGHKASFCLEDTGCNLGGYSVHRCGTSRYGNQGIAPNCYDLYGAHLDCQWIDVSLTPPGLYRLELDMNPSRLVPESDFSNNRISCVIDFEVTRYTTLSCEYVYISTPGHS